MVTVAEENVAEFRLCMRLPDYVYMILKEMLPHIMIAAATVQHRPLQCLRLSTSLPASLDSVGLAFAELERIMPRDVFATGSSAVALEWCRRLASSHRR